jgi:hypothetical protein
MKALFVLRARRTVADATAGVIPVRLALSASRKQAARREIFVPQTNDANKVEYDCIRRRRDDGLHVLIIAYCLCET